MGSSPAYPSDLTDAQWALIEPLVPAHSSRGKSTRGGRPLKYARRRIVLGLVLLVAVLTVTVSISPVRPGRRPQRR